MSAIDEIRSLLAGSLPRIEKAHGIAEIIRRERGYRRVGIYHVTPSEITAIAWTGDAPLFPRFPVGEGLNGAAVQSGAPEIVQDVSCDLRFLTTLASTRAEAIFPVKSRSTGRVVGTIDVESETVNAFTSEEQAFLAACADELAPLWS
jgi:GAF domain-containing protein